MSINIFYCVDHDLPTDNIRNCFLEFKRRLNSDNVVLMENDDWTIDDFKDDKWYIVQQVDYCIDFYFKDTFQFSIDTKVATIFNVEIDGEQDGNRWSTMLQFFKTDSEYAKHWIDEMVNYMRKYIVPLLHSKKLMLLADSSSLEHETIYDELCTSDKPIEFALELNNTFKEPCKVYWNYEAIGKDDFKGIYMFDL